MFLIKSKIQKSGGFLLIETLVTVLVAAVLLTSFATLTVKANIISRRNNEEFRASAYLKELVEVSMDISKTDWDLLAGCAHPVICHPEISGGAWSLVPGEQPLDDELFKRSLTVEDVYRDTLTFPNVIVGSGGVLDPDTKKVSAELVWESSTGQKILTLKSYVFK